MIVIKPKQETQAVSADVLESYNIHLGKVGSWCGNTLSGNKSNLEVIIENYDAKLKGEDYRFLLTHKIKGHKGIRWTIPFFGSTPNGTSESWRENETAFKAEGSHTDFWNSVYCINGSYVASTSGTLIETACTAYTESNMLKNAIHLYDGYFKHKRRSLDWGGCTLQER